MSKDRNLEELDILAYGDGLFDGNPAAKGEFEKRLYARPEQAERARAYRSQTDALRAAYDHRVREPVPEQLSAVLRRPAEQQFRRFAAMAAVGLLALAGAALGWTLGREDAEGFAGKFVERSYDIYVSSSQKVEEKAVVEPLSWLSEEISLALRAPDLSESGYSIVDKYTVSDAEGQMVHLIYATPDGKSFSLFLRPRWVERKRGLQVATERDVSIAYWLEGPLASAIASRLPPEETLAIAKTVQGELLNQNVSQPVMHPGPGSPGSAPLAADLAESPAAPAPTAVPQGQPEHLQVEPSEVVPN